MRIEDAQRGFESGGDVEKLAVGARGDAAAIEDEAVIAADRGGVTRRDAASGRRRGRTRLCPEGGLAEGEGRSAEVDDELRALLDGFGDRIAVVAAGVAPQDSCRSRDPRRR